MNIQEVYSLADKAIKRYYMMLFPFLVKVHCCTITCVCCLQYSMNFGAGIQKSSL